MNKMRRVGVLMGGMSAERDVSLRTGEGVARALEERGHDVVRISFGPATRGVDELVRAAKIDVAFLALHGKGGEDGCIQGLLELMGVLRRPYTPQAGRERYAARRPDWARNRAGASMLSCSS